MRNTVLSILSLLALTLAFAPTDADAGKDALRLRAEAGTERVVAGQPFVIESTFSNAGTADLEVFVPEHVGAVPFPAWTFVSQDGDTYIPHIPSFQSMWKVGLQGEVMKLAPGASRSFSLRVSSVVKKVDEKTTGWGDAVPLPPGRYTVTCRYTKEDAKVPYGADSMRMERVLKTHELLPFATSTMGSVDTSKNTGSL